MDRVRRGVGQYSSYLLVRDVRLLTDSGMSAVCTGDVFGVYKLDFDCFLLVVRNVVYSE